MTIGEFSMVTGLTPKALRLYDERGLLVPVETDPATGYRWYSATQTRHGHLLWALREAGVPLAELADPENLDLEAYEERLRARRLYEDTALKMARAIRGISLDEWPVTTAEAAAQPWVGTVVHFAMEDFEPASSMTTFETIPRHRSALASTLRHYDNEADGPFWTTHQPTMAGATEVDLLVCCPVRRDQREVDWTGFTEHIGQRLAGEQTRVLAGVLPDRLEVSCRADVDFGDENAAMAAGFAPRLAIDEYIRAHGLRPLTRATRELTFFGSEGDPVTVRDVAPHG
ncbi:MerR family DNA-binding transcriptional regulator [Amycolatopsis suaedae]|nr:MerR family DNA-binding transcriptional regulator [Amycolatopsis suaedae]